MYNQIVSHCNNNNGYNIVHTTATVTHTNSVAAVATAVQQWEVSRPTGVTHVYRFDRDMKQIL